MRPFYPIVILTALLVFSLSSCANHFRKFAPAHPTPGTQTNWPGVRFSYVKAYCYDYTADRSPTFLEKGRMHAGVMDPNGLRLSDQQVQRLLRAATVSQPRALRTPCYAPHHAFVFFNAQGQSVAVLEMCFGCNSQVFYPAGGPEYVDRTALWNLTNELGLPLGKGDRFYREAVLAYRSQQQR
jgi:hypothetical protein